MKKKVSLKLHHEIEEQLEIKTSFFKRLTSGIINFFFHVGLFLISIPKFPKKLYSVFKNGGVSNKNIPALIGFILLLTIAATPFGLLTLLSTTTQIGGRVLGLSDHLVGQLDQTKSALEQENYPEVQNNLKQMLDNLDQIKTELDNTNNALSLIVKYAPGEFNAQNLIDSAILLTQAGQDTTDLLELFQNTTFSPEGLASKQNLSGEEILNQLADKSATINSNLKQANDKLAPLNTDLLPQEYKELAKIAQSTILELSQQSQSLADLTRLVNELLNGSNSFLIVLQNNNELRPTGGFIGTIAQGRFNNGSVKNLDIRSVYDLDGQMLTKIIPPSPLLNVNGQLFLRDGNWFSDFKASSQLISNLYELEGGETPNLIMAITPDLFINLLQMTGPIELPTYRVTVTAENFIELIQTSTSVAYDKNLNQPKQLLADLYPALMQKLNQTVSSDPLKIYQLLVENFSHKNLLLYSRNPETQNLIEHFSWGGRLNKTDRDFLMINSSNLSGSKTDRFLKRTAQLNTNIHSDGSVVNQLIYTVVNELPSNQALNNLSWVRFLVPKGSTIISAGGFENQAQPANEVGDSIPNSLIEQWQGILQTDPITKLEVGQEEQYQFFGGWVKADSGNSVSVSISYQLPFKIQSTDRYSILWQKQPGMLNLDIMHNIDFTSRKNVWDNMDSNGVNIDRSTPTIIKRSGVLDRDYFGGVVLTK